jgi:hypothetical protein
MHEAEMRLRQPMLDKVEAPITLSTVLMGSLSA